MNYKKRTREQIAKLIAEEIPDGSYVNLGIGLPTQVAAFFPPEKEIISHSENGVLGYKALKNRDNIDKNLINASKEYIRMVSGGSFMHSGDSFDIMRGGHLDIAVLGAFQVSQNGDLANWHTDASDALPAVGGAMDLAVGAKRIIVCMEHTTKNGDFKIIEELTYPITGQRCVDRIYTDLCIIDLKDGQAHVVEMVEGMSFKELQSKTGCTLINMCENI